MEENQENKEQEQPPDYVTAIKKDIAKQNLKFSPRLSDKSKVKKYSMGFRVDEDMRKKLYKILEKRNKRGLSTGMDDMLRQMINHTLQNDFGDFYLG